MKVRKGFLCIPTAFPIRVHLLLIPLFAAAYAGHYLSVFALGWGCALLHEVSHILVAKRLGVAVSGITLLPFGICAPLKDPLIRQPSKEILIALAGPFCNLFLAVLAAFIRRFFRHPILEYGVAFNLANAALNLLPCLPLDGGRVLRAWLADKTDSFSAYRCSVAVSRFIILCLLGIGIILLVTSAFQFSVLMIAVFLFGNLFGEQKLLSRQALEELLYHSKKLERDALNPTRVVTAYAHLPARRLLRKLSYARYTVVHVVDKNQRLLCTLTEDEIITALLQQSIRITLSEIKKY